MHKKLWIAMIGFGLVGGSSHTFGSFDTSLFPETFSTASASIFSMNNTDYTNYQTRAVGTPPSTGTANVSGGELHFNNGFFESDSLSLITKSLNSSTLEKFSVSADAQGALSAGVQLIGLVAGNRAIGFWPGYSDANSNHAMYAYDPLTGVVGPGIGSGFGPGSGGAITGTNHVEISWDPSLTTWTYRFTKVNGAGAAHTQTIFDPSFVMGDVGVFSRNFGSSVFANFDNLNFIPEPSAAVLLWLGSALLWWRRRSG